MSKQNERLDQKWPPEEDFVFLKKFHDNRFGEITVKKHKTLNQAILIKEYLSSNKNDSIVKVNKFKERLAIQHRNLLPALATASETKKNLCSTNYIVRAIFMFPHQDLVKLLKEKKYKKEKINTKEITKIGFHCLNGLDQLHQKKIYHGDLRPKFIGLNPDDQSFYVLDRLIGGMSIEKCQIDHIVAKKPLFLSPELFHKIKNKNKKKKVDLAKNDVFSLGMVLLQLGIDQSVQKAYLANGGFDFKFLQNLLIQFEKNHGRNNPATCNTIRQLLKSNPVERPSANQVLASLVMKPNQINNNVKVQPVKLTNHKTFVQNQVPLVHHQP